MLIKTKTSVQGMQHVVLCHRYIRAFLYFCCNRAHAVRRDCPLYQPAIPSSIPLNSVTMSMKLGVALISVIASMSWRILGLSVTPFILDASDQSVTAPSHVTEKIDGAGACMSTAVTSCHSWSMSIGLSASSYV